ncbi:MAG: CHAD domain-containing protein, partial [Terriglobia bacterium]
MATETEIKLELPAAGLAKIAKSPRLRKFQAAPRHTDEIVSVYYDTRSCKLRKRGITLRLRQQGDRRLQTVKTDGDAFVERREWECEIDGDKPDFKAARHTALEPLLDKKLRHGLAPLFETRVRRTVVPLRRGKNEIELALDRGQLRSGRKAAPISEAELELKKGDPADLVEVAHALADVAPVRLGGLSKAQRGYRLVEGEQDQPVKSAPIALSAEMGAAEGFQAIALACLRQVAANQTAVLAADAEGVHQMRIGLRRLRTALALFGDLVDRDAQTEKMKHELKWITNELGPARELDVYKRK